MRELAPNTPKLPLRTLSLTDVEPLMPSLSSIHRPLGTMIAFGFPTVDVGVDLALAARLGASCLEILPDWHRRPDPLELRRRALDAGFHVHSVHGCWGGQSIQAHRVDLGNLDERTWLASLDDLKRCLDWLNAAGGRHLVVHPGGLSNPKDSDARASALRRGLEALADHATGSSLRICVENMPPGVHPGSRMSDLKALVDSIDRPEIGLAIDTGHANMTSTASGETRSASARLLTTHVHDNNARQDTHDPPGSGTIDWEDWVKSLDQVEYQGPIMLECIRQLRQHPDLIDEPFLALLATLTRPGT